MAQSFKVGDRVRLIASPPYVKTADSMPMLRPPDVVAMGEEGTVIDQRPGGYFSIRFNRGSFLLDSQYLEPVQNSSPEGKSAEIHIDTDQQ